MGNGHWLTVNSVTVTTGSVVLTAVDDSFESFAVPTGALTVMQRNGGDPWYSVLQPLPGL
jgi:hypothetical protein